MPKHDDLEIPPFLRRTAQTDRPAESPASIPPAETSAFVHQSSKKRALTGAVKDRIAGDIIAAVKSGHTTFGQIRKALNYDDRELKAGLRHARKWQPFLQQSNSSTGGRRKRVNYVPRKARIEACGRQYSVVIT